MLVFSRVRPSFLSSRSKYFKLRSLCSKRKYFDKDTKARHLEYSRKCLQQSNEYSYLFDEIGTQLVDRLLDIKRGFPKVLEVNQRNSKLEDGINANSHLIGMNDFDSSSMQGLSANKENDGFDLMISNLSLHWEDDLGASFKEINKKLKPDGAFIGAIFCDETLFELRTSFIIAEQEREGGISPRVSPFIKAADLCSLLNAANFTLSTVDTLKIEAEYEDIFHLADHLSKMGESNAVLSRRWMLQRDTLLSAASIYQSLFPPSSDLTGESIVASFQIGFFIGWKKHESQPIPKEKGSGKVSLSILSNEASR